MFLIFVVFLLIGVIVDVKLSFDVFFNLFLVWDIGCRVLDSEILLKIVVFVGIVLFLCVEIRVVVMVRLVVGLLIFMLLVMLR